MRMLVMLNILNMVFIKILELFKEVIQVFIKMELFKEIIQVFIKMELYVVIVMEYKLIVLLKVIALVLR